MARVIGVKFKNSGKSYFFDPLGYDVHKDDHVIVETGKGIDFGYVVSDVREIADEKLYQPLKPILRKATERDEAQMAENREKEKEAFRICLEKVHEHNLDMKLTEAEYAFDNSKILFYFTSEGYVDFRELVKDLAGIFRTRIELRQIGVRDEARALGGLGACGRPMCCATYLADFVPVSIKMAKEQNLPLNPTKISGVCGRLMCCLKNEEETYEELNKTMPAVGDIVEGSDGLQGEVFSTNVLRQLVKVLVEEGDEKEIHEYDATQITVIRKRKGKKNSGKTSDEAIDEKTLAALEDSPEGQGDDKKKDRRDKGGKGDKFQGGNREGKPDRGEKADRGEKPDRGEKADRGEKPEKGEKPDRDNLRNREGGRGQEGRRPKEGRDFKEGREFKAGNHDGDRDGHERNPEKNHERNHDKNHEKNRENRDGNRDGNRENREGRNFKNKGGKRFEGRNSEKNGAERNGADAKGFDTKGSEGKNPEIKSEEGRNPEAKNADGKGFEGKRHHGRFHGRNRDNRNDRNQNSTPETK